MKNKNGITMVYLVIVIIIMVILAAVSITSVTTTYQSVGYEAQKSELEELQLEVSTMIEDYSLSQKVNNSITSYEDYFEYKFNEEKYSVDLNDDISDDLEFIIDTYKLNDEELFLFNNSEINEYFGLEVSLDEILVDFSNAYVYVLGGIKDTDGNVYYSLPETGSVTITGSNSNAESVSIDPYGGSLSASGDTKLLDVTLYLNRSDSGTYYPIKKAYFRYSKTGDENTYNEKVEVNQLGNCKYDGDTVSFVISDEGYYIFSIEDTSGKEVYLDLNEYTTQEVYFK